MISMLLQLQLGVAIAATYSLLLPSMPNPTVASRSFGRWAADGFQAELASAARACGTSQQS
jgi:hypothetical protein